MGYIGRKRKTEEREERRGQQKGENVRGMAKMEKV